MIHGLRRQFEVLRQDLRVARRALTRTPGFTVTTILVTALGVGDPERLDGAIVTAGTFETVGVPAVRGRTFTAAEDAQGAACSVVISDALWQHRFGGDAAALGRRIRLEDEGCEIIGIMPATFN